MKPFDPAAFARRIQATMALRGVAVRTAASQMHLGELTLLRAMAGIEPKAGAYIAITHWLDAADAALGRIIPKPENTP